MVCKIFRLFFQRPNHHPDSSMSTTIYSVSQSVFVSLDLLSPSLTRFFPVFLSIFPVGTLSRTKIVNFSPFCSSRLLNHLCLCLVRCSSMFLIFVRSLMVIFISIVYIFMISHIHNPAYTDTNTSSLVCPQHYIYIYI